MSNSSYGVFTKETDLSQRISMASATIAVIVDRAPKGPVNERTHITDTAELEQRLGKRDPRFGYGLYAAFEFLKESNQVFYTRIVKDALTAGAYLTVDDANATNPVLALTNFDDGTHQPLGVIEPMKNLEFTLITPGGENILGFFACIDPGKWNNEISVRVRPSNPQGRPVGSDHDVYEFHVDVFHKYKGPSDAPVESFFVSRDYRVDGNNTQLYIEDVINNGSKLIRFKNNPYCPQVAIKETVLEFLDGASDGVEPDVDQFINGWDLYSDKEEVTVNIFINAGRTDPLIQRKMDSIARFRGDSYCILDVPSHKQEVQPAITYRRNDLNLNSSYSGIYSPDVLVFDDENNREMYIPPSCKVAPVFAHTDRVAELWFAPAGVRRGGLTIRGLRHKYKQGARDALDPAHVNPIRFISGSGYYVWGQQTMQSHESAFSNANVRRLFNFIKARISAGSKFGVFEPNDELLRAFLKNIAESFLGPIKRGRGLYEYEVVCDERNNTNDTIAAGDLILDVYADPVIPGKRIHITANVVATGASFLEDA